MKKIFSRLLLTASLCFATVPIVANASLIDTSADSSINGSIGGFSWLDENVSEIAISDPFQFLGGFGFLKTEIFNGSIANIALGSTGQPIQTAGGSYVWNTFYRVGSPDPDGYVPGLSIAFDYVTTLFTDQTYLADLVGTITYNTQVIDISGNIFGANNPALNNSNGTSSSAWTMQFDYIADTGNTNPANPGVSVPEPGSIVLLGAGLFGLMLRRKNNSNFTAGFFLKLF